MYNIDYNHILIITVLIIKNKKHKPSYQPQYLHKMQKSQKITKQTNRIKRLTSDLAKRFPQATEQFDQIIYAAIKIEKIITQLEKNKDFKVKDNYHYGAVESYQIYQHHDDVQYNDQYCKQTIQNINKFMSKVSKFDRKMNILIHQATFRKKRIKTNSVKNLFHDTKTKKNNIYSIQTPQVKSIAALASSNARNNRNSQKNSGYKSSQPQVTNQKQKKQRLIIQEGHKKHHGKVERKAQQRAKSTNQMYPHWDKYKQKQNNQEGDDQLKELDDQIMQIINKIKSSGSNENIELFQQLQAHNNNEQ